MNDFKEAVQFAGAVVVAGFILVAAWPTIIAPALPELVRMLLGGG